MPCHCTLFSDRAEPLYEFGVAHRNTVCWAPHGRFLVLAGFGNLAGEMDFYDVSKLKKLGSTSAHCTVSYGWSPCSRYFMTATLAPRMNVDNGLKLFTHRGVGPIFEFKKDNLFEAFWAPTPIDAYPDRHPSPKASSSLPTSADTAAAALASRSSAAKTSAATASAAKPSVYRYGQLC